MQIAVILFAFANIWRLGFIIGGPNSLRLDEYGEPSASESQLPIIPHLHPPMDCEEYNPSWPVHRLLVSLYPLKTGSPDEGDFERVAQSVQRVSALFH